MKNPKVFLRSNFRAPFVDIAVRRAAHNSIFFLFSAVSTLLRGASLNLLKVDTRLDCR